MLLNLYSYLERRLGARQSFRGKLLLAILVALNIISIFIFLYFLLIAGLQMDASARRWALQLIAVTQVIYFGLLVALLRGYFRVAAVGTLVGVLSAAMAAIGLTGGAPVSPAIPFLLLPAIFSFCILGARLGVLVSILIAAGCALQWYLSVHGLLQLPQRQSQRSPAMDALLINAINYMLIIIVLFMYERINNRLRRERDAERARLAHFATHDDLTGLANRRYFTQRLHEACSQSRRNGQQVAVVYIDLNEFKVINDSLGHEAGDKTLQLVAQRLSKILRIQDLLARIGGDEFAIIINPCGTRAEVAELCERLQAAISEPFAIGDSRLNVGASIGTAVYPGEAGDVDEVLKMADIDMYSAKQQRRRRKDDPR
jgi:diguanylate cyclase (GGDEF)-like protein